MSAVGVASLCRLRFHCSILLLSLYIHVFVVAVQPLSLVDSVLVCLRCAVAGAEFKVDILALAEYCL